MTEQEREVFSRQLVAVLKESPKAAMRKSSMDDLRLDNNDISLDEAVTNCGGEFFVCNAELLVDKG